jgi:hypothetical protein
MFSMATANWRNRIASERVLSLALIAIAMLGLSAVILARLAGYPDLADAFWWIATAPVAAGLAVSIIRDLLARRLGVDAIALLSMVGALALDQPLAVRSSR